MANFTELLNDLKHEGRTFGKGTADVAAREYEFAKICIWWLKTDPTYADTFKDIWLWYDWWTIRYKGLEFQPESGIDLVAETHKGTLWAIKVKCHLDTDVPLHVLTDFLSLSGSTDFERRLLISVGDLSEDAMVYIEGQNKLVQKLFYDDLNKSPVNWLDYYPSNIGKTILENYQLEHGKPIDTYSQAIELDPENANAYFNRGFEYFSGEHEKAIEDYSKAIELDPEHAEAYYHRGSCYSDLDEYEAAIEDYSKAIKLAS